MFLFIMTVGDVARLLEDAVALRFLPQDVDRSTLLPELQVSTHMYVQANKLEPPVVL